MKIPTILKGDTAAAIPFTVPESAAELVATYQGATRRFESVTQGSQLAISFTAAETAGFRLGTFPVVFWAKFANGTVKTYPIAAKIKVTDCPGLVYSAELAFEGMSTALAGIDSLPERHTQDQVATKLNEVISRLGGGAVAPALMLCASLFGAEVQTAPLGGIYNDASVVTNVTFNGLATIESVARKIEESADAATNALAKALAAKQDALPYPTNAIPHAAIIDAPAPADYSTSNAALVATIEATAPAPGNYAAVSNRAVNARGRLDLAVYGQEDAYIVEFFDLDDESQSFPALLGKMTRIDDIFYRIDGVEGYSFADDGFEMTFAVAGGGYAQWRQSRPLPDDLVLECTIGRRRYVISRPPTSPTGDTLAKASELATAVSNVVDKPYVESLGIESGVQSLEPATNYTDEAIGAFARTNTLYATTEALASVALAAASASLNADTALRLVMGENVWFLVTNYMRTVEGVLPSLELWEVRDGATNLVYSSTEEITNAVQDAMSDLRSDLTNTIPSKAWGRYQSGGADNPQPGEVLLVNEPTVIMTGGGEWNRYVETGGSSVWVLQSNGYVTFGGDTNGNFFAVKDDEGDTHFKVARTDSYEVDALPAGTGWSGGDFVVTYSSNVQPVLYATTNLTEAFVAESGGRIDALGIDVSWTHSGTNHVATIQQDARHPALFVHAKVTQEGGIAIINSAPTRFDGGIQIGNQKYSIGTYNDGARTFLILETTP